LAKDCKKLLREAELLLPPRAVTRLSKLLCSVASAVLAAVLELADVLDEVESVVESDAVLEAVPVLDVVAETAVDAALCVPELADCACKAAARLWMNCWSASAAVVASVLEDVEDAEVDADVAEALLPVVASVPVPVPVLELPSPTPTPLCCNASMSAPIKPPPGGGGGGALVPEVALLPLAVVDWLWLRKRDGSHCVRDDPPLPIELTLIISCSYAWLMGACGATARTCSTLKQCFGQWGSAG
jgi:hypothetical protein